MNHCVFYRTRLKYDGRVCALIQTLSFAFPHEQVLIYEYPVDNEYYEEFPSNVRIFKSNLFFGKFRESYFIQQIKAWEYGIKSFFFLLRKRPVTIQVHHEIVTLGVLLYKFFFRKVKIIYDDKELYHTRDGNIPKVLYWLEYALIEKSKLVIACNEPRAKALRLLHKNNIKADLIVDNFVFKMQNTENTVSKDIVNKIDTIKQNNQRVLLHQGIIAENRGIDILKNVANLLPDGWVICFIGINKEMYEDFEKQVNLDVHKKLYNIGYIDYTELNSFYQLVDACIMIYDSKTFNNNYCAPNRIYAAVNSGKPIIVNADNTILFCFVNKHKNGVAYKNESSLKLFFDNYWSYLENSIPLINKYEYNLYVPSLLNFYKAL